MKKIILGLLSVLFFGQITQAQPVNDMAVIPMGITIQSVMRLTITKGGNIEFVFNSASDMTNGIPSGGFNSSYETTGIVSSSRNWDLNLRVDESQFMGEDGAHNLPLNVVELQVSTTALNTDAMPGAIALNGTIDDLLKPSTSLDNFGTGLPFTIQWQCGHTNKIPGATVSQRYSANIILTLAAAN